MAATMAMAAMTGCGDHDNVAYTRFVNVPDDGWNTLDGREFHPFDEDTLPTGRYRMLVAMRHSERYPRTAIWLELEQSDSTGVTRLDTISIPVTDSAGRFLGEGHFGLYEVVDTIPGTVSVTPGWQLSIRHIMRDEDVTGLNNIGLILLK